MPGNLFFKMGTVPEFDLQGITLGSLGSADVVWETSKYG
jgi:hypothetical protein